MITEKEFSEIINSTKGTVLSAIQKNIDERFYHSIDDIVQETYIRAYRSLVKNKFRGDSSVSTWLYTIARNETLRLNKKLGKEEEKFKKYYDLEQQKDIKVDNSMIELHDSIDKLPDIYGDVMKLLVNGLSERQIADKLQIKLGTVKSRTSRGREILQRMMKGGEL